MPSTWCGRLGLAVVVAVAAACHPARPAVAPALDDHPGTITGRVTGPDGQPLDHPRVVIAIERRTGLRFTTRTTSTGAYTIRAPAGAYWLQVELGPEERLEAQPNPVRLRPNDLTANQDFVVAGGPLPTPASG